MRPLNADRGKLIAQQQESIMSSFPCPRRGARAAAIRLAAVLAAAAACFTSGLSMGQAPQRDPQFDVLAMLVKNAVTAVNHGNLTGNYTVLRDLGGPVFRERNSAAQLATIFQRLREQKSDLSPILVLDPQFTEAPGINAAGQLQLVGFFPTRPLQVQFRVAFQKVQAGWAIDTISIGTVPVQPPPQNIGAQGWPPQGGPPGPAAQPNVAYAPR
jgi:hypothetical protein